jgi:hypothetical protein
MGQSTLSSTEHSPHLRDKWESLQVTVVHNLYADREGRVPFTSEENALYIDTDSDHHYFQNKKIVNDRFLKSWETILDHRNQHIKPFCPEKERRPPHASHHGDSVAVRITTEGEYILIIDGIPFQGIPNTLGELVIGDPLPAIPDNMDPSPPAKWGQGNKGPQREVFPLPDEYALDEEGTPLDTTSVKTLTRVFSSSMKHKAHPSQAAWGKRLAMSETHWRIVASRYNNTILTPRDYHLHFKHITHRRIATNNRFQDHPSRCRFCHTHEETSVHLGRCPSLKKYLTQLTER